ncbi:unnamed protein product [Orchesella dallaii]|uniref:SURF1-like protein n=1 Tax=Orchesella dallaii TaxID=48710 RepID=A0ABP1RPN9_9HEXA
MSMNMLRASPVPVLLSSRALRRRSQLKYGGAVGAAASTSFLSSLLFQSSWSSSRRHLSVTHSNFTSRSSEHQSPSVSTSKNYNWKSDGKISSGGWFLLIIPLSTLALGIWQVLRWRWKLGLIDEMRKITVADPIPLPQNLSEIDKLEYTKVQVKGEFDYSRQVLIGPRALVNVEDRTPQRQVSRGVFSSGSNTYGYHIITPFKLEGRNEIILVNRGWVDSKNMRKYDHSQGPTEIVGIVRKTEQRPPFMSRTMTGVSLLHYRDVPTIAENLGTEEVWLDLHSMVGLNPPNSRSNADSFPVPGQTRVALRNEHVSYFVTWFSLSALTGLMWHRRFIRGLNLL